MVNLLIARHGNTFDKGDVILRVGRGTDLPLSNSGKQQAKLLGQYLKQQYPNIVAIYTSTLQRTIETANIALDVMGKNITTHQTSIFDEIDYGPDEGKPESEVIKRLGEETLKKWESEFIVPNGWHVDPKAIKQHWTQFASDIQEKHSGKTVLVVTSNGIARFAPNHSVKLSTGAVSHIQIINNEWKSQFINHKPTEINHVP